MKKTTTILSSLVLSGFVITNLQAPAVAAQYKMQDGTVFHINLPDEGQISKNAPPLTKVTNWAWGAPETTEELQSYEAGTFGPRAPEKGAGTVTLTKYTDDTSDLLQSAYQNQTVIPNINILPAKDSPRSTYNDYKMSNVVISSYQRSGEGKDETEMITFKYSVIHWGPSP